MNDPHASALPDDGWADQFAEALREQRARAQQFLAALGERQRSARADLDSWIARCEGLAGHVATAAGRRADSEAPAQSRDPRDRLEEKLWETERRLDQATERLEAMERRLAQACQAELEGTEKPASSPPRGEASLDGLLRMRSAGEAPQWRSRERSTESKIARAEPQSGVLDWEAEKRRIVAALEAEGSEAIEDAKADPRQEVEIVLRRTDVIVTEKDREISELRRLLEDQSANLGSVAVGAAALGGILDNDAIIQEERENLRRAQTEWQEKVRNAEIEISIERAKLARQRAEIEEVARGHGQASESKDAPDSAVSKPDKPPPGRWLARLGLKDSKNP